jgi:hypothetical protein
VKGGIYFSIFYNEMSALREARGPEVNGPAAKNIILEADKSAELASLFDLIEQMQVNGEAKFSPVVCRDLSKAISCRNYAGAVLELCHLAHIAEACGAGAGYVDFFWAHGPARSSGFRGTLQKSFLSPTWRGTNLKISAAAIDIQYPDGAFSVTFSRMAFLSSLMHFLFYSVDYCDLDDVFREMMVPGISKAGVSTSANNLSRRLYDYLKDHLSTAQTMRKRHSLIDYMQERHGPYFTPLAIDDETILDFWISKPSLDVAGGSDFKTYESVFRAFLRLRQALEQAADLYVIDGGLSIGSDREAGEVDPDTIQTMIEAVDEYRSPLLALQEPPADAIKFLNNKERSGLELLMDCGKAAFDLSVSLMRCEVFAKGQGRITQALRRKVDAQELHKVIDDCAQQTYEDRKDEFSRTSLHIDSMLLASLFSLVQARNEEAISLIVALKPDLDLSSFADVLQTEDETADNVVMFNSASVSDRFMNMIDDTEKVGKDVVSLVADARKTFKGISRQGFDAESLSDKTVVAGFAVGVPILLGIRVHLNNFLRVLEKNENWSGQFDADRSVFTQQFQVLYEER